MPIESRLMDYLQSVTPPVVIPAPPPPRVRHFWSTMLWGVLTFVAMFVSQVAVVGIFVLERGRPVDLVATLWAVVASGLTISLSVIAGLPAVLLALWLAIRPTRTPFTEYLALRWTSWRHVLVGAIGLALLAMGWDLLSRATGHDATPDVMVGVLKSAQGEGVAWLAAGAGALRRRARHRGTFRARLSLPRLVGVVRQGPRRHCAVVIGVGRTASAVRLVLLRPGLLHRSLAWLYALPQ